MKNRLSVFDRLSILKVKFDKKFEQFQETTLGKLFKVVLSYFLKNEWIEMLSKLFS